MTFRLKNARAESSLGGHAIRLDLLDDNDGVNSIEIPYENIPHVLQEITNAAAAAERMQNASGGGQETQFVRAHRVVDMKAGRSDDGKVVVASFSTQIGPVQIAMTADLTRLTIERLSREMLHLETNVPSKLS